MKKILLTLISAVVLAANSHAVLVLSDTFTYPNGDLTGVSGGLWAAHSGGGSGPVQVVANAARINYGAAEDVNRAFNGGAFFDTTNNPTVGYLYSSMSVNFTNLPTPAGGTYFAHFKDSGTANFRCRVFGLTTGAAAGKYRVGLGATNSASTTVGFVSYPQDLDINTGYTVVTRLNLTNGQSTMWINPSAETDTSVTNGAPDPGSAIAVSTYCFRQINGSVGVVFVDDLKVGTLFSDVAGANTAPLISTIANQNTPMATTLGPIGFTVQDGETIPATGLTVTSNSANTVLIPNANIALATVGGTGGTNRTVTITPATGQQGKTTITLTVSDGVNSTPSAFDVGVGTPIISPIPNQIISVNTPISIPFTVTDPENDVLTLSSNSSNPTLIALTGISITGGGANKTVTLTPELNQAGVTTITIGATDGFSTNTQSFVVTVAPVLGLIYSDNFSYPDGSLEGNGSWTSTSGSILEMQVTNGTVQLSQALGQDMNTGVGFVGGPFTAASGVVLYSGFTVSTALLPTTSGNFFAHFKDATTSGFRARVFATTANAAPGYYRIGISSGTAAETAQVANDLATNTTYLVVTRYNVATGESVIWVNPTSILNGGVPAVDGQSSLTITSYGLKEDSNQGIQFLDNLKIGTSLADVATIPSSSQTLTNAVLNGQLVLSWGTSLPNSLFALQSASVVTGPYSTIAGATSPYTNTPSGTQQYFRLKY